MQQLAKQLLKRIRKQRLIRAGDRVAVAVSGGADSVALLLLLLELRAELGIVLSVAHVNHKLRGEESDGDERFVAELARRHELELHCCNAPLDQGNGSGIEAATRELRYEFFQSLARGGKVDKIATAHTIDDQAETVLLRMFRGTGIRGLAGIHPRIVFGEDLKKESKKSRKEECEEPEGRTGTEEEPRRVSGEVVRPLLGFRRERLVEFLSERKQEWREDSTNRDIAFLRNRVRHRLLPMIKEEFGDSAIEHLAELAEIARAETEEAENEEREFSHSMEAAPTASMLSVEPLLALPLAAQRRLLRTWFETNAPGLSLSFRLIEEALGLAADSAVRTMEMPTGWVLRRGRKGLLLEVNASGDAADYEYSLPVPGSIAARELGSRIEAVVVNTGGTEEQDRDKLLNLELLPREIVIRNWRAGDRYWPAHTKSEKKVKELLSTLHATGAQKKLWPVAVAEGSGLVWMRGFAVPDALRARAGTKQAIRIAEIALQ